METKRCEECKLLPGTNFYSEGEKPLYLCPRCAREKIKNDPNFSREVTLPKLKNMTKNLPFEKKELENNQKKENIELEDLYLMKFGKDLVQDVLDSEVDPVIGREKEVEQVIRILGRKNKKNAILIGEPGVGKTAIIEGIAQRIAAEEVPESLKDVHIFSLDLGSVLAGTKYRGEFEEKMKKILNEVKEHKNIVLFLDEMHTLVGAGGSEGAMDAANILKPALSRGEIQMIGATTTEEYRKHIEQDRALGRRFQKVFIDEPTEEEAIQIISKLKPNYSKYHEVTIADEAIEAAVRLSQRYIPDRRLPDKAIDLIDEAASFKKMEIQKKPVEIEKMELELKKIQKNLEENFYLEISFEEAKKIEKEEKKLLIRIKNKEKEIINKSSVIGKEEVARILEEWTGIPAKELTKEGVEKLKNLEKNLEKVIQGQDQAVETVSKAIRRHLYGLKDENRPVGVFLFLGPTGVGKTELAKVLTKELFGKEERLVRFDMSEYVEKYEVTRLLGAAPGYIGHEEEGQLIKALEQQPYSVILLDEIEKAHPDVLNIFLQVFEDGRITSAKGKTVVAKHALFLMTSNLGSEHLVKKKKQIGWNIQESEDEKNKEIIFEELERYLKPEFINRLDEVVIFNTLTKENVQTIVSNHLNELLLKVHEEKKIKVTYEKEVIMKIMELGYKKEYGARSVRKEIGKVKDLIIDYILENEIKKGIHIYVENEKMKIKEKE